MLQDTTKFQREYDIAILIFLQELSKGNNLETMIVVFFRKKNQQEYIYETENRRTYISLYNISIPLGKVAKWTDTLKIQINK